jgi:predicted GNAT family N-acyltransferase
MKEMYHIRLGTHRVAVADLNLMPKGMLDESEAETWWIARINVPAEYRTQGHGSELLRQVLEDADCEHIRLVLEINPYGGLDYDELKSWYERHGFVQLEEGPFVREPNPEHVES